ncbi:TPA: hypothetical protein ACJEU7_003043 [Acinetobacter baumannii]
MSEPKESDDFVKQANDIFDRMKKAISNNKGVRLSADEMQVISLTVVGQIILSERTKNTIKYD